ncbi:MAG TPA: hypothetical protein VHV76_01530 [Mycobacteriales bacterium]|nr:hypothetical protein [Mycobacteriales bacterium]
MNVADYFEGFLALAVGCLPWVVASRRLVRRLLPDWTGPEAILGASIIGICGILLVAEALGVVDVLYRWVFAVVSAVAAMAVSSLGVSSQRRSAPVESHAPRGRVEWVVLGCVAVCVIATSMSLLGRDVSALRSGPQDLDSLHYHLTQAAHIVQAHNIDHLHHTASSDITAYYPYNAELLDAVGMLGPHPDIAVFGLNLLFGWLALLACWVIGARWSRGAPALAAGAAAIALPIVSQGSSGPGLNDLPTMAFLLSAVALLCVADVPRGDRPRKVWLTKVALAGASLGLAAGTKLSALAIVVLLALGTVVLAARDRRVTLIALTCPALLTGGFWYLRDWIEVGSPVPDLNLTVAGHGFHLVPYPEVQPHAFTVAHYLGDSSVIEHWFVPGLRAVWTDLWPLIGVVMLIGIGVALTDRSRLRRVLGGAVVVSLIAYIVTPSTAIGDPGAPALFATNTRYALPSIILSMVLLVSTPRLRRFAPVLTVGFTALTLALIALSSLPEGVNYPYGLIATVALGLAAFGARHLFRRRTLGSTVLLTGIIAVAAVGSGAVVQHRYIQQRYSANTAYDRLFTMVGGLHDVRIGVAGAAYAYPFYGRDFTNAVNYVGVSASTHAFEEAMTCPAMLGVLAAQHDDYVVVEPVAGLHTDRVDRWMRAIPGVTVPFHDLVGTVYDLPAVVPPDSCSSVAPR